MSKKKVGKCQHFDSVVFIADTYGFRIQSKRCVDEMGELVRALNRHLVYVSGLPFASYDMVSQSRSFIIDKMSEVQILLWQLSYLLDCGGEILDSIDKKLYDQVAYISLD